MSNVHACSRRYCTNARAYGGAGDIPKMCVAAVMGPRYNSHFGDLVVLLRVRGSALLQ